MEISTAKKIHLLDDQFFKELEKLYRLGMYEKHICQYFGFTDGTWSAWRKKGFELQELINAGEIGENLLSIEQENLLKVYRIYKKGRVGVIKRNLSVIREAASKGKVWQAAAWMLERMDPEDFGRKDKREQEDQTYSVIPAPEMEEEVADVDNS